MERLRERRPSGISGSMIKMWGLLFLAAGVVGRGVLQAHLLGIHELSSQQLLEAMDSSDGTMRIVTVSLVLEIVETLALPLFAMLTVEGFTHTSDFKQYFLRVLGLAVLTELPYNYTMGAKLLDTGSRNPVFGTLLVLVALYFYRRYAGKELKNIAIRVVVTIAAIGWAQMLQIEFGIAMVIVAGTLWAFRDKPAFRNYAGMAASMVCSFSSQFFMASPMAFLIIHFYNGEPGEKNRFISYLAYPAILLVLGFACWFASGGTF